MWQFSLFPSLKNRKTKKSSLLQVVLTTVGKPFASWRLCESIILRAKKLKEPNIHFFKKEPSSYLKIKKPIHCSESAFLYKVTKLIPILKYSAGPSELSIPKG